MNTTYRSIKNYVILFLLLALAPAMKVNAQSFIPTNLGSNANSDCYDVNPVLSKGGDTIFFSRVNCPGNHAGAKNSQDIWMTIKQADGTWGTAVRLPDKVNIARNNALYGVLDDGKTYLVSGIYDHSGKTWLRRGFSFVTCDSTGWSTPRRIKMSGISAMNEGDFTNASITPDGKYIFMAFSRRWCGKRTHLYVSKQKKPGVYSRPRRLRGPMEKFLSAEAPHYSPSENRLYFSGRRKGAAVDAYDIYYVVPDSSAKSKKKPMIRWKDVKTFSDTINSEKWDSYFAPNNAGTFAVFCSNRDSVGKSDIFRVMLVEERPWVKVTGKVINGKTGDLFPLKKNPSVKVNGQPSDSIVMEPDAAKFLALLPLDNKYVFTATAPHYTSDTVVVDVTDRRLYKEEEIVVKLTSVPYVQVSGVMMNNLSLTPIPSSAKPNLLIDGKKVDSVKIDPAKSSYTVNLPFGKKYQLSVDAREYKGVPMELDLTKFDEYAETNFDVFAKQLNANMVTLKGKLINTKTGKPLERGIEAKMKVNRVLSSAFKYNTKDASYTMLLPAGFDYDLTPSVTNFYNKMEAVNLTNAKPRSVVPRDFFVTPLEVGQSVDIENIYFETGKSSLKPESFRSLNALVEFFREYPNVKVEIGGHTDNTGAASLNRRLSKARAQAVAQYMIEQGISQDRFSAVGYGPDKPKATNKTKAGRAKNRRVDFTIMAL